MCDDNYEALISCFEKQVGSIISLVATQVLQAVVRPVLKWLRSFAFKVPKKKLFFLMLVTQKSSQVLSAKNMKGFEKGVESSG